MSTTFNTKKFWQGTNFWVALALLIAGLWSSFSTEIGNTLTGFITGIPAVVFAVRQLVKTGVINFKQWLDSANTWNYLAQIVTMIFGAQFADLLPNVQDLISAIGGGNLQGIIAAAFSLATMIFYLVRDRNQPSALTTS